MQVQRSLQGGPSPSPTSAGNAVLQLQVCAFKHCLLRRLRGRCIVRMNAINLMHQLYGIIRYPFCRLFADSGSADIQQLRLFVKRQILTIFDHGFAHFWRQLQQIFFEPVDLNHQLANLSLKVCGAFFFPTRALFRLQSVSCQIPWRRVPETPLSTG